MRHFLPFPPLLTTLVVAALVLAAGCSSPQDKRAAFREKMGPPQPSLTSTQAFLQNRLAVTAKLAASLPPRPPAGTGGAGEEGGRPEGRPASGGRWSGGEERGGPHGGGGMGMGGGGGGRGGPHGGAGRGASFPRQSLSLTLTNTSQETLHIRVQDVVSILGNFVPFPEKATLAPGESVTLEPMRGSLANLDELELTVGLAAGADRDRQTFVLRRG